MSETHVPRDPATPQPATPGVARPVAGGEVPNFALPDPEELSRSMASIAERSQRLVMDWMRRQGGEPGASDAAGALDPLNIAGAFIQMTARLMADPARLMQAQFGFWQDAITLWQQTAHRMMGLPADPVIAADPKDRRFKDDAWRDNEVFDFVKQSYLLSARYIQDTVRRVDGLDPRSAQKIDFYTRQFVDAMSPSNFVLTNPEVLRRTAETGGENLVRGLNNLLGDLERGRGKLRIRMTDAEAFDIGGNIANTRGKVVFQNDLMQLVQYAPTTELVHSRPLLIVPPWINKFYILDLRPKNSLVRWAVAQGHTVFIVSWVNPDERLAEKGFEDYMREGILTALDTIEQITAAPDINAIGYCLGGTLLACTLAWMAAHDDRRIAAATFFVTMLDFAESGELKVFIDEEQLRALEEKMQRRGYLEGSEMADTFNMLRANDLIWSFVVNNYLLGRDPFPFDLLHWNSDSTRMPARMHSFYLRTMYQQNRLVEPGGITLDGTPIDLSRVTVPAYFLSTREDHIAPWRSTYRGTQLLRGENRFVLAASGHIAGVINPPGEGGKYSHWINPALPPDPEAWLQGATEIAGSWWPDWQRWVTARDGGQAMVPAREPGVGAGRGALPVLEEAPGSYVRVLAN